MQGWSAAARSRTGGRRGDTSPFILCTPDAWRWLSGLPAHAYMRSRTRCLTPSCTRDLLRAPFPFLRVQVVPVLRNLSVVKGIEWPDKVKAYYTQACAKAGVSTYEQYAC